MAISATAATLLLPSLCSPYRRLDRRPLTSLLAPPFPLSNATKQRNNRHHHHKHHFTTRRNPSSFRCNAQLLADLAPATSAAYGALLLGGGLFAYARSGSKGSIFGGATGAALMGVAYYLLQSPETKELGEAIGFGSSVLFSCVFGIRLVATRKFVPSGLLLSISVGALAVFFSAYMQAKA